MNVLAIVLHETCTPQTPGRVEGAGGRRRIGPGPVLPPVTDRVDSIGSSTAGTEEVLPCVLASLLLPPLTALKIRACGCNRQGSIGSGRLNVPDAVWTSGLVQGFGSLESFLCKPRGGVGRHTSWERGGWVGQVGGNAEVPELISLALCSHCNLLDCNL